MAAMTSGTRTSLQYFVAAFLCAAFGCESKADPPKQLTLEVKSATPKRGTTTDGGGCRVSDDCVNGLVCADDRTCQSPKTIECRGRQDVCVDEGRCVGRDNKCVAASDDACKKSHRCETEGRCSLKDDKCAALSANDCSALCKSMGRCTIEDGSCVAGSTKDCLQSEACKQSKRCRAVSGRCIGR